MDKNKTFDNQWVMITGASAGFGEAMAKDFAKEGANLILLARREEKLTAIKQELEKNYAIKVIVIKVDVSKNKQLEEAFYKLKDITPDILVNNAGLVKGLNKTWQTPEDAMDQMIDTNIKGVLNLCRLVIPKMIEKNKGHIINIGSISGYDTYPGGSVYCATKFAVRAITDTLRKELVDSPIRVSMISPGMAETEFSKVRFDQDEEKAKAVYANFTPLTAEDVSEAVLFIANRPASVTIADLVIYPTNQASVSIVHRKE